MTYWEHVLFVIMWIGAVLLGTAVGVGLGTLIVHVLYDAPSWVRWTLLVLVLCGIVFAGPLLFMNDGEGV